MEKYACTQYEYNLPKCVLDLVKSASAEATDPENYCLLTIIEMVLANVNCKTILALSVWGDLLIRYRTMEQTPSYSRSHNLSHKQCDSPNMIYREERRGIRQHP